MLEGSAPVSGEEASLPATLRVEGHEFPVWPVGQVTETVCGAQIVTTQFADHALYQQALTASVLAAEADPRFRSAVHLPLRGACGSKVHNVPGWDAPVAQLIHARAMMMCHHAMARSPVFVDDAWASIYRDGDYCMAHSHIRSDVSVIYMLDPGDDDPLDKYAGQLAFTDPRIAWCCALAEGHPTRPVMPTMTAGTMLVFWSVYLHSVNPYRGQRPRITMSWNVTRKRLPGVPHDRAPAARVPITDPASPPKL